MTKRRTYVDANVLIAAFQGDEATAQRAQVILDDPERALVISEYVRLETLPKPVFHRREEEVAFMEAIFAVAERVSSSESLVQNAVTLAAQYDLAPVDALHASAAIQAGVDEFVTLEKPSKPLFRLKEIRMVSIYQIHDEDS
ncbi:MAG: type II toxin-antitoxin system VapC family toxin [Candidatus Competibacteraceae bacterium]